MIFQSPTPISSTCLSAADKIAIFRSLFRGREDLYAKRFENRRSGKSGYAPACHNEWIPGVCEKPRIKCSECPNRRFLPVTDEVIKWHLSGQDNLGHDFVMGIYPMLGDETCFLLAIDFDKTSWREDAVAFLTACYRMGLPAALERSRSGEGAHVWLFFADAISAALARQLGSHILTEAMEHRPDIGFDSYDRLFPNQDTMPRGSFGSLIALPLQKRARNIGNSLFIDQELKAYEDQWAFLSTIRKIERSEVEAIVNTAQRIDRIIGVRLSVDEDPCTVPYRAPFRVSKCGTASEEQPTSLDLIVGNEIYFDKQQLTPTLRNRLVRLAAFQNPEFYRAQAMRLPTYDKPRIIGCAREYTRHIGLPRGCLEEVNQLLSALQIKPVVSYDLYDGQDLAVHFAGELRPEQRKAAEAMLERNIGVLSATTAFGKTVVAAWLIAQRHVNTLVLVHRKQLQEQWLQRLSTFLNLPAQAIGRLGGGRKKLTGTIDIGLIQSVARKGVVNDLVNRYGHLIIDECHHLPASTFEEVVLHTRARFITGLTATLIRKDGCHPIVTMRCGPVRYHANAKQQAALSSFEHLVLVRPTDFRPVNPPDEDARAQFRNLYHELILDNSRNQLICNDVAQTVEEGRSPIVLTERNAHLDDLAKRLVPIASHLIVLRGGMTAKETHEARRRLAATRESQGRVVLATGRLIGEGFDDSRLDTLFLTLPISWRGTIAQYVGRLHRNHDSKREVRVYDYADLNVPMLERMFNRRCRGYEDVGYRLVLPASAISGWPIEAPLPVHASWKADYGATVRRLVRDGIDLPLAKLFMEATETPEEEVAIGARSATEAFLYRRLESLPQTAGRFHLNGLLPIPFNGLGQMEVDLLCVDRHIAIELDGAQHLDSFEAYRRDRRKDLLLQEHGYLVLRFLSCDVCKHLDAILDTILRALA